MFTIKLFSVILAAAMTPAVLADSCSAVGTLDTNSAGFGEGGTTYTNDGSIVVYKGSDIVGNYTVCPNCDPVCSDQIPIDSSLPQVFLWGASCGVNSFRLIMQRGFGFKPLRMLIASYSECHGAYSSQTHIDGDKPQNGKYSSRQSHHHCL